MPCNNTQQGAAPVAPLQAPNPWDTLAALAFTIERIKQHAEATNSVALAELAETADAQGAELVDHLRKLEREGCDSV